MDIKIKDLKDIRAMLEHFAMSIARDVPLVLTGDSYHLRRIWPNLTPLEVTFTDKQPQTIKIIAYDDSGKKLHTIYQLTLQKARIVWNTLTYHEGFDLE
jgi:hypothetical protein